MRADGQRGARQAAGDAREARTPEGGGAGRPQVARPRRALPAGERRKVHLLHSFIRGLDAPRLSVCRQSPAVVTNRVQRAPARRDRERQVNEEAERSAQLYTHVDSVLKLKADISHNRVRPSGLLPSSFCSSAMPFAMSIHILQAGYSLRYNGPTLC